MLTKTVLNRLSSCPDAKEDSRRPKVNIGNALPSGYVIVTAGAGFWYRRNQSSDPETTLKEGLSLETGDQTTLNGDRTDCCRLIQVFVDVETPDGDIVLVSKTLQAPSSSDCIVQESLILEPTPLRIGTTLDLKFK